MYGAQKTQNLRFSKSNERMSVLALPGTGADSADHGRSGVDGISLPTFPVTGAESLVHAYFGDDGISLPKYVYALPTFPVTGTESLVHAYFGDDGISLPKYVYADASYHLIGVYSNLISSSSPYFFPNPTLHQGVVCIIRRILVRYGTDTGARKYCGQLLCTIL